MHQQQVFVDDVVIVFSLLYNHFGEQENNINFPLDIFFYNTHTTGIFFDSKISPQVVCILHQIKDDIGKAFLKCLAL